MTLLRRLLPSVIALLPLVPGALLAVEPYRDPTLPAAQRAADLLARMTQDEKLAYIGGDRDFYIRAIPRLEIPAIKMSDGPMGSRNDGKTTCYGGGVALAATWDQELAQRVGRAMGRDCRSRGVHILLAPGVNISRSPTCGRNFEYLGEDPFLAGKTAAALIRGIQGEGVQATVKHFAGNNQEWDRHHISSEIDERTLHEIYLPAFRLAVDEGRVAWVMTAYNLLNGPYCAEHDDLVNGILRRQWGFTGGVMSDWGAVHHTLGAALGGTDLEMPSGARLNAKTLAPLLADGTVPQAVIDGKVRNILTTIIAGGFLDRPQQEATIPADDPAGAAVALAGARAGLVLARNEGGLLPIDAATVKTILVVGPNAHPAVYCGSGSGYTEAFHPVSILDGLRAALPGARIIHHVGLQKPAKADGFTGAEDLLAAATSADLVVACVGFGQDAAANSAAFPYKVSWPDKEARALGLVESEGSDRPFALHPAQVETLRLLAGANRRVVAVLNSGAGVDPAGWADAVPAVLCAWYPGQAVGTAVAEVLTGAVNPSGKMPVTFGRRWEDYPCASSYLGNDQKRTFYREGVNVGYRGFDAAGTAPWFAFGHGLSYTTFTYADLTVAPAADGSVQVACTVTNTGARAGAEVVQVYVTPAPAPVPRPPKELKGYAKVALVPGETRQVTVTLPATAFAYWNVAEHAWTTAPGSYGIVVGASSRDLRLNGTVTR